MFSSDNARRYKILGIFAMIMAAFLLLEFVFEGLRTSRWPSVQGLVTVSEVVMHESRKDRQSPTYTPRIQYQFTVGSQSYTGEHFFLTVSAQSEAYAVARSMPVGRAVTVFYDPKRPAKTTLEPGVPIAGVIFCLLFGAFGFALCFAARRKQKLMESLEMGN